VTASSALPIASTNASRVRASNLLSAAFTLEKASSMGLKSGRVGRQVDKLAASPLDQLAHPPALVHRERLSITTTCPGLSEGTKKRSR
jgi:hypothetical protein